MTAFPVKSANWSTVQQGRDSFWPTGPLEAKIVEIFLCVVDNVLVFRLRACAMFFFEFPAVCWRVLKLGDSLPLSSTPSIEFTLPPILRSIAPSDTRPHTHPHNFTHSVPQTHRITPTPSHPICRSHSLTHTISHSLSHTQAFTCAVSNTFSLTHTPTQILAHPHAHFHATLLSHTNSQTHSRAH